MNNLWTLPDPLPAEELFETLLQTPALRVERIVSTGQMTPPGQWYDQERDAWVVLLQGAATLEYEAGELQPLSAGDHVLIPARRRHRVIFTSQQPPCLWLAIHGVLHREPAPADEATPRRQRSNFHSSRGPG